MKFFRFGLLSLAACLGILLTQAQTADEIINKNIEAIGGKDVLSKIKSVYLEGTATAMGTDYPTSTTIVAGKGFKNVTSVNGSEIIQCFTDTSGWSINPMAGQTGPTPLPADLVKKSKSSLDIGGELVNYKSKGFSDSLMGRETFQGVNAYKIKLSQPGIEINYLIDPTTYYVLKKDSKFFVDGKDNASSRTYSNYKKTDIGYVAPNTLVVTNMGYDVTINYTKVEVNKNVDLNIFAMPK
jgi:hypothetical protein